MRKFLFTCLFMSMVLLTSCSEDPYKDFPQKVEVDQTAIVAYKELVKDHLYYIESEPESTFHLRYEGFLIQNPKLQVIAVVAVPAEGSYNTNYGYRIFTQLKEE